MVVGLDTAKPNRYWRGDQMLVAFNANGPVGWARKIFPVGSETDEDGRAPILLFENDFDDERRVIQLPSGGSALLSVCYDAFLYRELARGPTAKRTALRFKGIGHDDWDPIEADECEVWLGRFQSLVQRSKPVLNLIGIHRFRRPGSEILWQRHGIATASAALGGALTIGAAHFVETLPDNPGRSPLASYRVPKAQLGYGPDRREQSFSAHSQRVINWPGTERPAAVVRIFKID